MKWLGLYKEFFQLLSSFKTQRLESPSLIVMGNNDYLFLKNARKFHLEQSRSRFHCIENSGHIVNIEASHQFNELVLGFLKPAQS